MCGVEDLSVKLRQRRLRWLEHVKWVEGEVLGEVGGGESWWMMAGGKA